jgi:hypothetical protein
MRIEIVVMKKGGDPENPVTLWRETKLFPATPDMRAKIFKGMSEAIGLTAGGALKKYRGNQVSLAIITDEGSVFYADAMFLFYARTILHNLARFWASLALDEAATCPTPPVGEPELDDDVFVPDVQAETEDTPEAQPESDEAADPVPVDEATEAAPATESSDLKESTDIPNDSQE